jgi:hypothetical protein
MSVTTAMPAVSMTFPGFCGRCEAGGTKADRQRNACASQFSHFVSFLGADTAARKQAPSLRRTNLLRDSCIGLYENGPEPRRERKLEQTARSPIASEGSRWNFVGSSVLPRKGARYAARYHGSGTAAASSFGRAAAHRQPRRARNATAVQMLWRCFRFHHRVSPHASKLKAKDLVMPGKKSKTSGSGPREERPNAPRPSPNDPMPTYPKQKAPRDPDALAHEVTETEREAQGSGQRQ